MDQQTELAHLHKAEVDISKARDRLARQEKLIARLTQYGHDASTVTSVLQSMRDTLAVMEEHRALILRQLAAKQRA
jgi:hypothetical protein